MYNLQASAHMAPAARLAGHLIGKFVELVEMILIAFVLLLHAMVMR